MTRPRALQGEQSGTRYTVGQKLTLRLEEADPVAARLRFGLPHGEGFTPPPRRDGRPPRPLHRRGRPANIRHQGKRR